MKSRFSFSALSFRHSDLDPLQEARFLSSLRFRDLITEIQWFRLPWFFKCTVGSAF